MAEPIIDAFLVFNDRESSIDRLVDELQKRDVGTHIWRSDIPSREQADLLERQRLASARTVLVILGPRGWGADHLRLTIIAQQLEKPIIPVLVGEPPADAFAQAGELFLNRAPVDVRRFDDASLRVLASAVFAATSPPSTPSPEVDGSGRFDAIVRVLTDESDEARADLLRRIVVSDTIDRGGLGKRLRLEISDRYNPGSERGYTTAIRDPKRIASVRSWMLSALIWSDGEDPRSRDLILKHLNPSNEPDQTVRFWTLAGLYSRSVSYLADALQLCAGDDAPEVGGLARTIVRPHDDSVVGTLRSMLHAPEFATAWAALRILRVVAVVDVVPDICALLDAVLTARGLTYDVLYALSSAEMAAAAVPILTRVVGASGVVERVIAQVRVSGGNAVHAFAVLLAAFDVVEVDRALATFLRDSDSRGTAEKLRRALAQRREIPTEDALFVAGYSSDTIDVARERLGIDQDVQTLTTVMLAQNIKPPLAIGLFGDWGSGKSYFMRSMNAAAVDLAGRAKAAKSPQFCHDIVQIEFNAWHYADTNLWANLVSTILERLAAFVTPRATPEEEQAALLKELGSAKSSIDEANAVKAETQKSIAENQEKLVGLQRDRQQKEITLRDLRVTDVKQLLAENPKVGEELRDALTAAGMPALLGSADDLSRVVTEAYGLQGRITALFVALTTGRGSLLLLALVVLLVVIPLALHELLAKADASIARVSTIVSEIVVALGGVVTVIGTATRHVSNGLKRIEGAKASVDALFAAKRAEQGPAERQLQDEILGLKAKEQEASARVAAAASRVTELEDRIRTMREARTLARFLDERSSSDDYRKYLGLISTVRRDFEVLSKRLHDAKTDSTDVKGVDRIVLYIDDLDRCPAHKVMEVLQAVHLLLAFELFVVVVGVDPRWLLHSLERTLTAFQPGGADGAPTLGSELWATTPRDYLEKIFQIPFSVLPMSETGYGRLMADLLGPGEAAGSGVGAPAAAGNGAVSDPVSDPVSHATRADVVPAAEGGARIVAPGAPSSGSQPHAESGAPERGPAQEQSGSGPQRPASSERSRQFTIHEEALTIRPWEEAFAERLYRLIPTPRAAKRFSNVYRILKAPIRRQDLPDFEGTAELPGDFRVVMLLLAVLIGAPTQAADLFPQLYQRAADGGDMTDALLHLPVPVEPSQQLTTLQRTIEGIVGERFGSAAAFKTWLPRVSRFSFDVGRGIDRPIAASAPALVSVP